MFFGSRTMSPEHDGQLSGMPFRSCEISWSACAGLYVAGRGLRIESSRVNHGAIRPERAPIQHGPGGLGPPSFYPPQIRRFAQQRGDFSPLGTAEADERANGIIPQGGKKVSGRGNSRAEARHGRHSRRVWQAGRGARDSATAQALVVPLKGSHRLRARARVAAAFGDRRRQVT